MKTWLAGLAAVFLLGACATGEDRAERRETLARDIADDAAAFNEAYAQAVSGQILLNILRARDRLPRYYLAMTGIADSPSWRYMQSGGIGGIPLGDGGSPWGIGSVGLERETERRPAYAVQPFDEDTLTRTVFEPTETYVFAHYWRSGWPRDLLLLMSADQMTRTQANGVVHVFSNEANEISRDCAPDVDTDGCTFVRELRTFLTRVSAEHPERGPTPANARAVCGLLEAYAPAQAVRPVPPAEGQRCEPVFVVGDTTYSFRLRSLDEMVYYIGEMLRAGSMNAGADDVIEAPVTIRAAGLRGGGEGVPLFRLLPAQAAGGHIYTAEVVYGGHRYFAGPANGRSCADAASDGPCADTAAAGDRSSSVLSLIAEILALNQSPESIRAPNRLIAE